MAMDFDAVDLAAEEAVKQGVFPGAVLLVGRGNEVVYERAFGSRSLIPDQSPMQLSTIFDVASLTKPLATAIAMMLLVSDRKLDLDDPVAQFVPTFGGCGKSSTTIRHLLNHSSGLPAWKPYYEQVVTVESSGKADFIASGAAKSYVLEQIHREKPLSQAGTRGLYSDLGFLVLGEIIENISGSNLAAFCHDRIYEPWGLCSTAFVDLTELSRGRTPSLKGVFAPTEICPWRKKVLCGQVHDDNAYAVGGIAGHAGLFSTAREIHTIVARLDQCLRGSDSFLPQSLVQEFFTRDEAVADSTHALGWDTPSLGNSASGSHFSRKSIGHLGFTGTSVWWDLEKNCHIIVLSNRVHPTRRNEKIKQFRPHIHDLMMQAVNP